MKLFKITGIKSNSTEDKYARFYCLSDEFSKIHSNISSYGRIVDIDCRGPVELIDCRKDNKPVNIYVQYEVKRTGYGKTYYILEDYMGIDTASKHFMKRIYSMEKSIPEENVNISDAEKENYIQRIRELGTCYVI